MIRWLIGVWAVAVGILYFSIYFSSPAESFEPDWRYLYGHCLYMVALAASTVAVALGLMRARQRTEE